MENAHVSLLLSVFFSDSTTCVCTPCSIGEPSLLTFRLAQDADLGKCPAPDFWEDPGTKGRPVTVPVSRRRIDEFRHAFEGEIDSLAALYRNAAADMLDVLADASAIPLTRQRAIAHLQQYQATLADLHDEAAAWIELNIPRAYGIGLEFADEGIRNIRGAGINVRRREREVFSQVHREAVAALTDEALRAANFVAAQIGRRANDVFRRVGIEEVAKGGRGEGSRRCEPGDRAAPVRRWPP